MPIMPKANALAIFCADLHLSDKPPIARSGEPDWYEAMARPLKKIRKVAKKNQCPVICAGDIFHKAKSSPELEIFAMGYLQGWFTIAGQHDLPNHRIEDIDKSSYGVLISSGIIHPLVCVGEEPLYFTGFQYGQELKLQERERKGSLSIAVIHQLAWHKERPFPGAPDSGNVKNIMKQLKGFDYVFCGDNHTSFQFHAGKRLLTNCGSIMRRTSDQIEYEPKAWVLWSDGVVDSFSLLDDNEVMSCEHIEEKELKEERNEKLDSFVKSLIDKGIEFDISFKVNMNSFMASEKISPEVRNLIENAMEDE